MIASFTKAVAQLSDPQFRRSLLLGLLATVLVYILLYLGIGWGMARLSVFGIAWADRLTEVLGSLAIFVLTVLMFPSVVTLVLGFLLDDVAAAVERRYYPGLPPPRRQKLGEMTWGALRFALVTVAVNLVALPFALVLLFAGIGVAVYYAVNGYLLAREYFELVAWRRVEPTTADAMRRRHAVRLWLDGVAITFVSTLPVVNLVAPLIGTAVMVHEFENLRAKSNS